MATPVQDKVMKGDSIPKIRDWVNSKTDGLIPKSQKGANNGVASLNANGKVPDSQLPLAVYSVHAYATFDDFPQIGIDDVLYLDKDAQLLYYWNGGTDGGDKRNNFTLAASSLQLGETATTAFQGYKGKLAYAHISAVGNPHHVSKNEIGLGNVPNKDFTNDINSKYTLPTTGIPKSDLSQALQDEISMDYVIYGDGDPSGEVHYDMDTLGGHPAEYFASSSRVTTLENNTKTTQEFFDELYQ